MAYESVRIPSLRGTVVPHAPSFAHSPLRSSVSSLCLVQTPRLRGSLQFAVRDFLAFGGRYRESGASFFCFVRTLYRVHYRFSLAGLNDYTTPSAPFPPLATGMCLDSAVSRAPSFAHSPFRSSVSPLFLVLSASANVAKR